MERAVRLEKRQEDEQGAVMGRLLTEEEERKLEAAADALLAKAKSAETPVYSEVQLARRGRRKRFSSASPEMYVENAPAGDPQDFLDELKFLMSVTELKRIERCLLHGWMAGWTQPQIRRAFPAEVGTFSQQHLSRLLREAILKCYSSGLSFEHFSHHTIYRKPSRHHEAPIRMTTCRGCGHPFAFGLGAGRFYCCVSCREAKRR